jgi:hypothetical protein
VTLIETPATVFPIQPDALDAKPEEINRDVGKTYGKNEI